MVRVLGPVKCDVDLQRKVSLSSCIFDHKITETHPLQDGWSPLHLASWNGHHDVVRELVAANCQVNTKNEVRCDPVVMIQTTQDEAIESSNVVWLHNCLL